MDSPEQPDTNGVPRHTTPTWEMELLVSGGTVFGLMQLSGLVDDSFVSLYNRVGRDISVTLMPLWIYAKFVLVMLIGTFLVHLCIRGYWVALVGMNSVYPGGVDWAKLRVGPLTRQYLEKTSPTMPVLIENTDNLATRVFGVGFGFAMMMMMPVVLALVSVVLSVVLKAVFGVENSNWILVMVFAVVFVPWGLAAMVDQRWGKRIREGSIAQRILLANFALYDRLGFGRNSNPLASTFMSRVGIQRWGWMSFVVMGLVFTVVVFQIVIIRGGLSFGDFPGLPANDRYAADSASAAFYASQTQAKADLQPLPYIPDRIARGPYLEVFVPYLPRRHTPAMRLACPAALAKSTAGDSRASLDCLAKLHDARLDGAPLTLIFDASSDRRTGQPGMLAMVPIQRLAPGRHELSLLAVDPRREKEGAPARRYRIPFWK